MSFNLDSFEGRFGFQVVDDSIIQECKNNPLIIPRYYRYLGMGHYRILAQFKGHSDLFLSFVMGGADGHGAKDNYEKMKRLGLKDTIDLSYLQGYYDSQLDPVP